MKQTCLNIYMRLFGIISKNRPHPQLPDKFLHAHLVTVLSTGILMWSYAILAWFTISHPLPGLVGLVASMIHLFSPLLFRFSNNYLFVTSVMLGAGMIHQCTFAFFTGGFDSNILIWLGILPMLAGITAGKRGTILWSIVTTAGIFTFFLLKMTGYLFPVLISYQGMIIAHGMMLFGWIFIATCVTWSYIFLVEKNAEKLEIARIKTQNLINILSHDLSTPLTVVSSKLNLLLKTSINDVQLNAAAKAAKACERLGQITQSVKDMRLSDMGKKEITMSLVNSRDLVIELNEIFFDRMEQKNIFFNWSVANDIFEFHSSRSLVLNQVLGNLLSNSIKFSPLNNEISLNVSCVDNTVQFLIEDHGVGIPKDMRENVFFAELSRSNLGTDGESGTGFGLPIVKSCIDRLGGSISFITRTSDEGTPGTIFKINLPLA